jgi:phage-related protein
MTSQALIDSETFKLSPEVVSVEFGNAYRSLQIARLDREIDALKAKVNSDPKLVRQLSLLLQEQSQLKSQRMTPSSL